MRIKTIMTICILTASIITGSLAEQSVRIKDIAQIEGTRGNQLVGYGLVVGLDGTGDTQQAIFTAQSVANMLRKFGVTVSPGSLKVKNVAAVMITADLPAFARPGSKIDILVSSVGDAKSIQGGTLLQAPLQAANGDVYAVAQGSVSIGGFSAGGDGSSVTKNHPTAGRVPNGAIVEKEVPASLVDGNSLNVVLNNPDFTTASRVMQSICAKLGPGTALAKDPATIKVTVADPSNIVGLISDIGELSVEESSVAKVIVNERTGTVIIGGNVRLSPVAISHGSLSVEVTTDLQVSQPQPDSKGKTAVVQQKDVSVKEDKNAVMQLNPGATLEDLVKSLNELKVTPRDIIAILQALKQAGALHAELEII